MNNRNTKDAMTVSDAQNFVVDGILYDASIMPRTKAEMWRRVSLRNATEITGSIFCGSLEVHNGPCTVIQSVFVKDDITIKLEGNSGRSVIRSCVHADRSMTVQLDNPDPDTLLVIVGDLYAKTVNLTRCVLYGNLYCENGIVSDSVIAGTIYSTKRVELSDVVVGMFLARTVVIKSRTRLLQPVSAAENRPEIDGQLEFLMVADDTNDIMTSSVVPFVESDIVHNRMTYDDPEAILPNYVVGIGSRLLDASVAAPAVLTSANRLARLFVRSTNPDSEMTEDTVWEQRMLLLVNQEVPSLAMGTLDFATVKLPEPSAIHLLNGVVPQSEDTVSDVVTEDEAKVNLREVSPETDDSGDEELVLDNSGT
jgi:hypothetical protein